MKYRSTRGAKDNALTSPAAIIQGLAQDGGLYVPVDFPKANFQLEDLPKLSYKQISAMIISLFFDDFSKDQIKSAVINAYSEQWDDRNIVPIEKHNDNFYMELFHGPTLAFKDIALQMLPQLMTRAVQIEKIDRDIIILTATSGDTGTASMRGFANQKVHASSSSILKAALALSNLNKCSVNTATIWKPSRSRVTLTMRKLK